MCICTRTSKRKIRKHKRHTLCASHCKLMRCVIKGSRPGRHPATTSATLTNISFLSSWQRTTCHKRACKSVASSSSSHTLCCRGGTRQSDQRRGKTGRTGSSLAAAARTTCQNLACMSPCSSLSFRTSCFRGSKRRRILQAGRTRASRPGRGSAPTRLSSC